MYFIRIELTGPYLNPSNKRGPFFKMLQTGGDILKFCISQYVDKTYRNTWKPFIYLYSDRK